MAEIGSIWNELHTAASLLNSPNDDGLKTAESVFVMIDKVLNDEQLLAIISIPDDPIVCMEALKGLARRYNSLHSEGNNSNVWKQMLKLCMGSPDRLVYRTGFPQIATILSYHYKDYIFIECEPSGLREDFINEIELYMNESNLPKLLLFLSDLINEMSRGWRSHCGFGIVDSTTIKTWSRDFLVPQVFQWLIKISGYVNSIVDGFNEDQYELYCTYLSSYQSLLRFNSPLYAAIEEDDVYYLPKAFENDVSLVIELPMVVLRRTSNVPELVYKILEVLDDIVGHKISQAVSHPLSEANKQITIGLANNLLEITRLLPDTYALEMLAIVKRYVINLPFEFPVHELSEMVFTVSVNVFRRYIHDLDDLTIESMNNLRDIWRRLKDRSEDKLNDQFFTELLATVIPIIETAILNESQMNGFLESEVVKTIGGAIGLLAGGNFQAVLQMFTEKMISYIEKNLFITDPVNAGWNLYLFSECIQSLINNGGSDLAVTYYGSEPPTLSFRLEELLKYPYDKLDTSLLKLIVTPFHFLNFVCENREKFHCHIVACGIHLISSATLLICKLEDDNGLFKVENVINDIFVHVFTKVYNLSLEYKMVGDVGQQLANLSKNMSLNDLFLGHDDELLQIVEVCFNGGFAPPKFTGSLFEGLLRPPKTGENVAEKMVPFFLRFSSCANKIVDDKVYLNYAILQFTGIFKEAGYVEFFENIAAKIMDSLADAIQSYGEDDLILRHCLELFREIIPSYLSFLSNYSKNHSESGFERVLSLIDKAILIGNSLWLKADEGNYTYDSLILLIESCSDILERIGIIDLGENHENIINTVVSHFFIRVIGVLSEKRIMSLEVANVVFNFIRHVCETSNVVLASDVPENVLRTLHQMLLFGLDPSRNSEICSMALNSLDNTSNKMKNIPAERRSIWIEFFKSLFEPIFKIALSTSSSSDTFWTLSNFFFNMMLADPDYMEQFFRSSLTDSSYQEEVTRLMQPLQRETLRAKRCDFRERFTLFKDRAQNFIRL